MARVIARGEIHRTVGGKIQIIKPGTAFSLDGDPNDASSPLGRALKNRSVRVQDAPVERVSTVEEEEEVVERRTARKPAGRKPAAEKADPLKGGEGNDDVI
jgi:hypothetical protein